MLALIFCFWRRFSFCSFRSNISQKWCRVLYTTLSYWFIQIRGLGSLYISKLFSWSPAYQYYGDSSYHSCVDQTSHYGIPSSFLFFSFCYCSTSALFCNKPWGIDAFVKKILCTAFFFSMVYHYHLWDASSFRVNFVDLLWRTIFSAATIA